VAFSKIKGGAAVLPFAFSGKTLENTGFGTGPSIYRKSVDRKEKGGGTEHRPAEESVCGKSRLIVLGTLYIVLIQASYFGKT